MLYGLNSTRPAAGQGLYALDDIRPAAGQDFILGISLGLKHTVPPRVRFWPPYRTIGTNI